MRRRRLRDCPCERLRKTSAALPAGSRSGWARPRRRPGASASAAGRRGKRGRAGRRAERRQRERRARRRRRRCFRKMWKTTAWEWRRRRRRRRGAAPPPPPRTARAPRVARRRRATRQRAGCACGQAGQCGARVCQPWCRACTIAAAATCRAAAAHGAGCGAARTRQARAPGSPRQPAWRGGTGGGGASGRARAAQQAHDRGARQHTRGGAGAQAGSWARARACASASASAMAVGHARRAHGRAGGAGQASARGGGERRARESALARRRGSPATNSTREKFLAPLLSCARVWTAWRHSALLSATSARAHRAAAVARPPCGLWALRGRRRLRRQGWVLRGGAARARAPPA
jgi:hypothetical protein